MLNRFLAAKKDEQRAPTKKRPYLATECVDLHEADRWRQQIIKEIGRKVMEIQNAGLGEHRQALHHACIDFYSKALDPVAYPRHFAAVLKVEQRRQKHMQALLRIWIRLTRSVFALIRGVVCDCPQG